MESREFYNYIMEHFSLEDTAARLVDNIIEYVKDQDFVDAEDAHAHLNALLGGAFGIEMDEIRLYRAPGCAYCGKYVPGGGKIEDELDDESMCSDCRTAYQHYEEGEQT